MNTNSRSYYVSQNGNNKNPGTKEKPWKDISYAVSQKSSVKAGDTVLVQAGTYKETITLEKSGNSQQGHINLKANGKVVLRDPNPTKGGFSEGVIQAAGKDYWVIDGFRIENTSWAGISLRDADNIIVQNNHTYETGASGIIVMPDRYFGGGEKEVTSSNIKILNNTVERANWKWRTSQDQGSPQEALTLWGVDGFEVADNVVKNTKKEGIDIKTGSRNGSVHNNTVTGTAQVSGTSQGYRGGPAIYVDGNRANVFNIDIYNNTVHNNIANGINIADEYAKVGNVSDIRVYNNVVYDNGKKGINGGVGIGVGHNVTGVEIINNTFVGNVQAFSVGGNLPSGYAKVNDVLIRNNVFADSSYRNGYIEKASNVTLDHNVFTDDFKELYYKDSSTKVQGSQNTAVASVGFVNVAKKDFRLAKSSAAIDKGSVQIGSYAQSALNGVQRSTGGGVDAGAFEFSTAKSSSVATAVAASTVVAQVASTEVASAASVSQPLPLAASATPNNPGNGSSVSTAPSSSTGNSSKVSNSSIVTLSGDRRSNVIRGGDKGERILGLASNDKLSGNGGNDFLSGDSGNDWLSGGSGNDQIEGGSGSDKLFGDSGNDILIGGTGSDRIEGGSGNDKLFGDSGNDLFKSGSGNDQVDGGEGDDKLFGDSGDDVLKGGFGNDFLVGGSGNDQLIGTYAEASQRGGAERDVLLGNGGADTFWLGDASQSFYAKKGNTNYALIQDFRASQGDILQLHGSADQYSLGAAPAGQPKGTAIYLNTNGEDDLIAVIKGNANLTLASDSFKFV